MADLFDEMSPADGDQAPSPPVDGASGRPGVADVAGGAAAMEPASGMKPDDRRAAAAGDVDGRPVQAQEHERGTRTAGVPLAELMRPRHLDEVVGQSHLLGPDRPLRLAFESGQPHSMIL